MKRNERCVMRNEKRGEGDERIGNISILATFLMGLSIDVTVYDWGLKRES